MHWARFVQRLSIAMTKTDAENDHQDLDESTWCAAKEAVSLDAGVSTMEVSHGRLTQAPADILEVNLVVSFLAV